MIRLGVMSSAEAVCATLLAADLQQPICKEPIGWSDLLRIEF
jgi:hypothetical protein